MISRIENTEFRIQYMLHSIESNSDTRTLQRNIKTQYIKWALELDNPVAIMPPIPGIWCQLFRLYCAIIKCLLN